jgi:putative addiction module component (TIGR02574 family)
MLLEVPIMKLQEVRESALALPRRSRQKLVRDLEQSLDYDLVLHACPPGVLSEDDPNFEKILKARLRAYERGEVKGIPWENVLKRLKPRPDENSSPSRSGARTKRG